MDEKLIKELNDAVSVTMRRVTERAYEILIDTIDKTIYQPQPKPSEFVQGKARYHRTYDFRDKAWIEDFKDKIGTYVGRVYFDGLKMTPPSLNEGGDLTHGNAELGIDRRKYMADILRDEHLSAITGDVENALGYPGAFWPTDYWSMFLNQFIDEVDALIIREFKKLGITLRKVG